MRANMLNWRGFFFLVWIFSGVSMQVANAAEDSVAQLTELVQRHADAQSGFNVDVLKAITADNYIEVSPVGELDSREKMLGFYAVENKRPGPAIRVEAPVVRMLGEGAAVVVAKLNYSMSLPDGQNRQFAMRATYGASRIAGTWKLNSAHYTGIRPPQEPKR
jgi:ketosteroid isomerase-like protein